LPAEEDRRERRRKLGLPEELTPEEVEAQRAREAEAAAKKEAQRLKDILPIKPVSGARPPRLNAPCPVMDGRCYPALRVKGAAVTLLLPLVENLTPSGTRM